MSRNFIELPSLEAIAEMEKLQSKFIESLEMSDDGSLVKCQEKCGSLYPDTYEILYHLFVELYHYYHRQQKGSLE